MHEAACRRHYDRWNHWKRGRGHHAKLADDLELAKAVMTKRCWPTALVWAAAGFRIGPRQVWAVAGLGRGRFQVWAAAGLAPTRCARWHSLPAVGALGGGGGLTGRELAGQRLIGVTVTALIWDFHW